MLSVLTWPTASTAHATNPAATYEGK